MTVIAYDGLHVAADRQATTGHTTHATVTKIEKFHKPAENVEILGTTGDLTHGRMLATWYKCGADEKEFPAPVKGCEGYLYVFRLGKPTLFYGDYWAPAQMEERPAAYGSGAEAALGAMLAGADAEKAVRITSLINADCGNGVTVLDFNA